MKRGLLIIVAITAMTATRGFADDRQPIEPLLSAYWDQGPGTTYLNRTQPVNTWNMYCSYCFVGSAAVYYAPAGCVPVAMAQVVYYLNQHNGYAPALLKSTEEAYTWTEANSAGQMVNATTKGAGNVYPAGETFDWDAMASDDDAVGKPAIAKLIRACGLAAKVKYRRTGTSSAITDAVAALQEYFGLDDGIRIADRTAYTAEEWEELLYSELAAGRPMLIRAKLSDDTGGHEFVVDGYRDGKFHVTYGYGGWADGYFKIDEIPSPNRNGYAGLLVYKQRVAIGIQPETAETQRNEDPQVLTAVDLTTLGTQTYTRASAADGFDNVRVFLNVMNCNSGYRIGVGLGLYDSEGTLVKQVTEFPANFSSWKGYRSQFGPLDMNDVPAGSYRMKINSRYGDRDGDTFYSDEHDIAIGSDRHYIDVDITATTLTLRPSVDLVVNSVRKGELPYEVVANMTNRGTEENTAVYFLSTDGSTVCATAIPDLKGGETKDVKFYCTGDLTDTQWQNITIGHSDAKAYLTTYSVYDAVTGIRSIDSDTPQKNAGWYTLTGIRIAEPQQAGIYIRDGKKVVVR